jgi:tetratricopeptide (TPR) repeat protein
MPLTCISLLRPSPCAESSSRSRLPACYAAVTSKLPVRMLALHKLEDTEEILHEALPVCEREGRDVHWVSRTITRDADSRRSPFQADIFLALCAKVLIHLSIIAQERGDLEVALDFAQRALNKAREEFVTNADGHRDLTDALRLKAGTLELLGRLDEALALDAECRALNPGQIHSDAFVRLAKKHMAAGEDDEAEQLLRACVPYVRELPAEFSRFTTATVEETLCR